VILDLPDELGVVGQDEVDGDTLSAETSSTTNPVDVVLLLVGKLVVDDESDLLNINTSCKQISGNKNPGGTGSELFHDGVSFVLVHLTMHGGDCELLFGHSLLELKYTLFGVAVDEGLVDVKVGVKIEKDFDLPFFFLDSNIILCNTFESQILFFDKNFLGIAHEVFGQAEDLMGHCSGEKCDLNITGQKFENVLNLFLETAGKHLISLIHDKYSKIIGFENSTLHHIVDTARSSNNDMHIAALHGLDVFLNRGTADASMNFAALVLTDRFNDKRDLHRKLTGGGNYQTLDVCRATIDCLQGTNGKGTSFTCTGLSLGNGVMTLDDW
jgi:hypothetical protein